MLQCSVSIKDSLNYGPVASSPGRLNLAPATLVAGGHRCINFEVAIGGCFKPDFNLFLQSPDFCHTDQDCINCMPSTSDCPFFTSAAHPDLTRSDITGPTEMRAAEAETSDIDK